MAGKPKIPGITTNGGARPGAGRPRVINRLDVVERLGSLKYDPITELIKIARDPSSDAKLRKDIAVELLGYCAPKLKQIEQKVSTDEGALADILKYVAEQGRPKA
jgi:hypothetical protein